MRSYNNLNFFLTYSFVLREVLFNKLLITNTFACPIIKSGAVFLELNNLDTFDSSRLIAASFILKILTDRRPYIIRFDLFQTFSEKNYDVVVQVNLRGIYLFNFVKIIASDILPFLSKIDLEKQVVSDFKHGSLVRLTIADLSFLRVVETHFIFFKWHDKVRITFLVADAGKKQRTEVVNNVFRI